MLQRARKASSLILVLLVAASMLGAQQFRIRARIDLVVVPVSVKGHKGRLVAGLSKEDFKVLEDGRPQVLTHFASEPVPMSAAVLVDTGLKASSLHKIQESFAALAGAFSDFDEVAVYRFDNDVVRILDFTKDTPTVEASLKTLKAIRGSNPPVVGGPFSQQGPIINGVPVIPSATPPTPQDIKVLDDALFTAAADLEKRASGRRKIVLVVSDGQSHGSDHSFDETVAFLLQAGIEVYAIRSDSPRFLSGASVLDSYARWTGGDIYYCRSTKAMEDAYAKAAEQARNQYVLGYVSSNEVAGQTPIFRQIEVHVQRPGLEARHRKGYYQYP